MSQIDTSVARILDSKHADLDSDDEDALIASLEDSPAVDAFREQRIQQLHSEFVRGKEQKSMGFGTYTEIKDEKQLMEMTTEIERVVVHFKKSDFARCGVMDGHLESLATTHTDTRFLSISVDNCPFLVTKLAIKILPCVLCFIKGVSVDRIVGFEGLGYTPDTFTTKDLETRLLSSGVLLRAKGSGTKWSVGKKEREEKGRQVDEDDDDWD